MPPSSSREDVPSNVTVVVVSYNTADKLRRCLAAIEPRHDVVVVDNSSTDGSADMVASVFPDTILVRNDRNRGFGAANNQGIALATRPHVLLLNSDAYSSPGAIDELSRHLHDSSVVAVAGRLTNPDGSIQNSTAGPLTLWAVFCEQCWLERAFPRSRLVSPYWNTARLAGVARTEQAMGACLMIKPVERFDERFFLYCEDTDLCLRLRKHGVILYVPQAMFVHDLGSSSSGKQWLAVSRYNRGKELYFRIHGGVLAASVCWAFDRTGALLRLLIWTVATVVKPRTAAHHVRLWIKVLFAPINGYPDAS